MLQSPPSSIPIAAPDLGPEEEAAVLRVLRSGHLAQGPEVDALEGEFAAAAGLERVIAVSSGTAALHAALSVAGAAGGDEVLVPAFTFAATANAVIAVGARPVFVDIGDDFLIDLDDAAAKLTERTVAIMPVHLFGLMADMGAVQAFAEHRGLAIVEDAAQAHLAYRGGRPAGGTGIGAFSLYATKNMMSGEGGLVATSAPELDRKVRLFRNHGMASRYEHVEWGLNFRMSDVLAAIAREQLRKLPAATARRQGIARRLSSELPAVFRRPQVPEDAVHVFHQYTVRLPAEVRDRAVNEFRTRGVGVDVYYPTPANLQPSFAARGAAKDCPHALQASREVLSIPVHPKVGDDDVGRILMVAGEIAEVIS